MIERNIRLRITEEKSKRLPWVAIKWYHNEALHNNELETKGKDKIDGAVNKARKKSKIKTIKRGP
jgi:hypothetical protein